MPELPEIQTTVTGLQKTVVGKSIQAVWTNYASSAPGTQDTIKDTKYYKKFSKVVCGATITKVSRRAKNILLHLSNGYCVLIHLKMTGHLLYGTYRYNSRTRTWSTSEEGPLSTDPYNGHIRLTFSLSDDKHLVLSDIRKFAKVVYLTEAELHTSSHLSPLGPEPLESTFTALDFQKHLSTKKKQEIKQTLLDQSVVVGIGNIYADESLWRAGIHPLSHIEAVPKAQLTALHRALKQVLSLGVDLGLAPTSDYRTIAGERAQFKELNGAYRKTGTACQRKNCTGTIRRIVCAGRGTHFCDTHQRLYN